MTTAETRSDRTRSTGGWRRIAAAAGALVLIAGLAACAPEPGHGGVDGDQTAKDRLTQGPNGEESGTGSWPEKNRPEVTAKHVDLPGSFPKNEFVVPEGAAIDDTGERGEGQWFLVLRAADADAAGKLWDQVISSGKFTTSNEEKTADGGRSASLTSPTLAVQVLTLPQSDGSVLLSYDLSRAV